MPIPTTVLKLADSLAGRLGLLDRRFAADDLIRRARRRTGLEDFGDVDLGEPLRRFLDSCSDDACLSLIGRFATHWDVVRFLSNLLLLRAAERDARRRFCHEPIAQPIFIAGLPRSGTTFLHRMMLEDPGQSRPAGL